MNESQGRVWGKGARARAAWAAYLILAEGCAGPGGGWDYSALPGELAETPAVRNSRLFDSAPHLVPWDGGLVLFLCRWSGAEPIPVSLPPDADPRELRILREALEAWSAAGLGVRFREVVPEEARLEIRFVSSGKGSPRGTGDALADCAIEYEGGRAVVGKGRVQAELVWASIHLVRRSQDPLGRLVLLDDDELLGAVLHEMGHALGYSAHPVQGASIMQRTTDEVRKMGARVAAGGRLAAPNLEALYALPSGVIVGEVRPPSESMDRFRRFESNARGVGLAGPYSRVGDRRARYFYRDARGKPFALSVQGWPRVITDPQKIVFEPNPRAEILLRPVSRTGREAP
jgi:hypothetical protein